MVNLEDIFAFMKQDKADRAKQRMEDMNMIKEMISKGVKAEVLAALEPVHQRQEKLEEDQKYLHEKLNAMLKDISDLKLKSSGDCNARSGQIRKATISNSENAQNDLRNGSDKELEIVCAARRTVGLQNIFPADLKKHVGSGDENEAMLHVIKEYMVEEMKVSEELIDELEVERVFPSAREHWNTLYIQFAAESSVPKLYSYTRNMRNNSRLVPYIPKQFYSRCKELESKAYILRHSETKYKTRIRMGISDLELHKRRPFENFWTTVQPQYYTSNQFFKN